METEELRQSCWIGDAFVVSPIRAVIVNFHGLGFGGLKGGPSYEEAEWAAGGGLVVFPYYGPWSWMNHDARKFIDEMIDAVYSAFRLNAETPLIIAGGSMGGQGALIYTRYAARRVTACFANFPVCDLEYHFTERPDLPATMRHAFRGDGGTFAASLVEHSPLKQAPQMPDIPYLLIHGDQDKAVNKERHSDRFVAEMRALARHIEYLEVPGMGHGSAVPFHVYRRQIDWVKGFFGR